MQEELYRTILDLNNRAYANSLRVAACQFGFEFDHTIVSKEEYEEFLRLPPGDLWYYVYKQKLLCENLEQKEGSIVPDITACYRSMNSSESICFSNRKKYIKKRINDSDEKYGIIDYDIILNEEKKIEYQNSMIELPDACAKSEMQDDIYDRCTADSGFLDDIGKYEKLKEQEKLTGKIGIRCFQYLLKRKIIKNEENIDTEILSVSSPSKLELLSVDNRLSTILGFPVDIKAISGELDQCRIPRSVRKIFKAGIFSSSRFPLYLADDAEVVPISPGEKWGIINCKYNAYMVINKENDITLFDQSKFELKTYPEYWLLRYDKNLWTEERIRFILFHKFKDCHYPVSKYFKKPEKDKRNWQIYKPDEKGDLPEFHVLFPEEKREQPDIYITQYIKVSIRNPRAVADKLARNILLAFKNHVNVLCLPELVLFLPSGYLQKAMESVYSQYIARGLDLKKMNRDYNLSNMLIFSSTYFKPSGDSHCHINLGVGVYIHFDESGIITDVIKIIPFQKQVYSPIEYTKNNITSGIIPKPDAEFLKWINFHYWEIQRDKPDTGDKRPIRLKCGIGTVDLYPFICADFIANKIFKSGKILNEYKNRVNQTAADRVLNIIVVSAYSEENLHFYENIVENKDSAQMVVYSNNGHPAAVYSGHESGFGCSFIYYPDIQYDSIKTDLLHFDKIEPVLIKKYKLNFAPDYGIREGMIIATITSGDDSRFCKIHLPKEEDDDD